MLIFSFSRQTLRRCVALLFSLAVVICAFWGTPSLRPVSVTGLKPVYAVERSDKTIALSFDASWGAEHTEELLAILAENDVKTTFFLVNLWIEKYPDLVEAIAAGGHEIGLHSATHPHFTELSAAEMSRELRDNQEALKKVTGKGASIFRPPYGDYNDDVITAVNGEGLTAIQWSVDSLDWQGLSADEIYHRVVDHVAPGAIVLLHNDGDHTAEALKMIVPALKKEGYTIVPVGELLLTGDCYVDIDGVQRKQD